MWITGRKDILYDWLSDLEHRLFVRRIKSADFPFIESYNKYDLLAEYIINGKRPREFTDESSYLLLMILEICFSLDEIHREELLNAYFSRIVEGKDPDGTPFIDYEIDLLGWDPPADWEERILTETVISGVSLGVNNFKTLSENNLSMSEKVLEFVNKSRKSSTFKFSGKIPRTVLILACIKNASPLPPEFWREWIFGNKKDEDSDKI